jgi:PIN domain nuclease of toxin-antitoxin system
MSEAVLDASAVLALIQRESGAERITAELLVVSTMSSVNLAEVQSKLVRDGVDAGEAWRKTIALLFDVQPFTLQQARIAGDLIMPTRSRGLSLGDRACLALATELDLPVYTTEQVWRGLDVGVKIHVIR